MAVFRNVFSAEEEKAMRQARRGGMTDEEHRLGYETLSSTVYERSQKTKPVKTDTDAANAETIEEQELKDRRSTAGDI